MTRKAIIGLAVLLGAVACPAAVFAQSPAEGARFPTNAEDIEFLAGDDYAGEDHRLTIARDRAMQQVVYDAVDPDGIGQWFVTPREHRIGRGDILLARLLDCLGSRRRLPLGLRSCADALPDEAADTHAHIGGREGCGARSL